MVTGEAFLQMRVIDLTLHAWDLARAIGVDARLDPGLVELVLRIVESSPGGMGFGITPLGQVSPAATAQARLLDLAGRC
ncbi:MAG TPA: hypothetical protein VK306_13085 [Acidimicrobiales bacterium]|nr:hypothetical protein [Acidimicrobiales bacterium]